MPLGQPWEVQLYSDQEIGCQDCYELKCSQKALCVLEVLQTDLLIKIGDCGETGYCRTSVKIVLSYFSFQE